MSKAVLISIRPKWCALIANGEKTVEVRKMRPKLDTPFKCYIYCTINGDALALPHLNDPKYSIHRMFNGKIGGRKMSAQEREKSNYKLANGKVIGEFVCDKIYTCVCNQIQKDLYVDAIRETERQTQLSWEELCKYQAEKPFLYGWHISALQIYDRPKELREITKCRYEYCKGWCGSALGVLCSYQRTLSFSDKPPKVDLNIVKCARPDKRAPQSWCYVEELQCH